MWNCFGYKIMLSYFEKKKKKGSIKEDDSDVPF